LREQARLESFAPLGPAGEESPARELARASEAGELCAPGPRRGREPGKRACESKLGWRALRPWAPPGKRGGQESLREQARLETFPPLGPAGQERRARELARASEAGELCAPGPRRPREPGKRACESKLGWRPLRPWAPPGKRGGQESLREQARLETFAPLGPAGELLVAFGNPKPIPTFVTFVKINHFCNFKYNNPLSHLVKMICSHINDYKVVCSCTCNLYLQLMLIWMKMKKTFMSFIFNGISK